MSSYMLKNYDAKLNILLGKLHMKYEVNNRLIEQQITFKGKIAYKKHLKVQAQKGNKYEGADA